MWNHSVGRQVGLMLLGVALVGLPLPLGGCTTDFSLGSGGDGGGLGDDASLLCGNGVVDDGEECDDANRVSGDGCSDACQQEACDADSCEGCCDVQGVCRVGNQDGECGSTATQCTDCSVFSQYCVDGTCGALGSCEPGDLWSCGDCGHRVCGADGTWGNCDDQGECAPGELFNGPTCGKSGHEEAICQTDCTWGATSCLDESGECAAGTVETGAACGDCGTEERTCQADCSWSSWTCGNEGGCTIGDTQSQGCGDCGTQSRTCQGSCTWSDWSSCTGEGCHPGATQSQPCGDYCGTKYRSCNSQCNWGSWGSCTGQGVCTPGATQSQSCPYCGTQVRTCSSSCAWLAWGSCTGQGVCTPGQTSPLDCGYKTCTSNCQWGGCTSVQSDCFGDFVCIDCYCEYFY